MTLKIEVNHPEMEDGLEFDLGGFLVPNGGSVELSEDQELGFLARHKVSVKDALKGNAYIKVSGKTTVTPKQAAEYLVDTNAGAEDHFDEVDPETLETPEEQDESEGSDT
jgi:hypothetical protein